MRFLVDECTGPQVASWLRSQGHEIFSVFDETRGMEDGALMLKAYDENWILITNDKDFGEKVYRERRPQRGVILCGSKMSEPQIRLKSCGGCWRGTRAGWRTASSW